MKNILIIILLWSLPFSIFSQSSVEVQIMLLSPETIFGAAVEVEPLSEWIKLLNQDVEADLQKEKGDKTVFVLLELHPDAPVDIQIGASPEMDSTIRLNLLEKLSRYPSPQTRYTSISLAIVANVNKGNPQDGFYFNPRIDFPGQTAIDEFKALSFEEKQASLRTWILEEVIPVTAYHETHVESTFEGVLAVGKMMEEKQFVAKDIEAITTKESNYWRATMEMAPGNQMIPFSKMCMHIANGELDRANTYLLLCSTLSNQQDVATAYVKEISQKLELIQSELEEKIQRGIVLHEEDKYEEAIAYYDELLKIAPHSAWLNYERYFAYKMTLDSQEEVYEAWKEAKKTIYRCNPMYYMDVVATNGEEAYLLIRRQKINTLFTDENQILTDFLEFADIALDLGNYGIAAQTYWALLPFVADSEEIDRDFSTYFLYCMEKLGNQEIVQMLDPKNAKKTKQVAKEREKLMKESQAYQSMK